MENSEAARQLASLRQTREKTCPVCGTKFQAFAKQRYDSKRCANRADYARHAEARRAAKRLEYERHRRPAQRSGGEQGAGDGEVSDGREV
jgi:tRNA(Ile2) C34 agmatinyltransferase TiaS